MSGWVVRSFKKSLIICYYPQHHVIFLGGGLFFQCGIFHCCKIKKIENLVASLMILWKILSKFGKLFLDVKIARFIYMVQVRNQNCIRIFKFFLIILGL